MYVTAGKDRASLIVRDFVAEHNHTIEDDLSHTVAMRHISNSNKSVNVYNNLISSPGSLQLKLKTFLVLNKNG